MREFVTMFDDESDEQMEPTRPSATPLKTPASASVAGGGEPPYDGGMEHRMTALETRLDTILPTLATKADVDVLRAQLETAAFRTDTKFAELRSDMHKMNADIRSGILTMMLTIVGTMVAAIFGISQIYKGAIPTSPATQPAPIIITIPGVLSPAPPANPK
jgi:hypothetical protein